MLILERSVTSLHSQELFDHIKHAEQAGRKCELGRSGVFKLWNHDECDIYAIFKERSPVAWLYLERQRGWQAWEVRQVFVLPEFRGRGYATRLYKAAVNVNGIILASGKTKSKTSRALWQRFIEQNTFNVWAHDFKDLSSCAEIVFDEGELICALPVYTRKQTRHDVRLIAIRK